MKLSWHEVKQRVTELGCNPGSLAQALSVTLASPSLYLLCLGPSRCSVKIGEAGDPRAQGTAPGAGEQASCKRHPQLGTFCPLSLAKGWELLLVPLES